MLKRGSKVRWSSYGPHGHGLVREGTIVAYIPPGTEIQLPKRADPNKLRASLVNTVHGRYLVEVKRRNRRSGKSIPSHWLAPKAVTLEERAHLIN